MKKKICIWLICIFAAICIVGLAACGSSTTIVATDDPAEKEETTETEETDVLYEESFGYKKNDDDTYSFYKYKGKATAVTIPAETTEGAAVTAIAADAFNGATSLTQITIPASVKSVGRHAFDGCIALIQWETPTITTLSAESFAGYAGTGLIVPNSVTTIEAGAFNGATAEILWDDPALTVLKTGAFGGYLGRHLTVPSCVTEIERGALTGCSKLERLTIPFVGRFAGAARASQETEFGYIFGVDRYDDATAVMQRYSETSAYVAYYLPDRLRDVNVKGGELFYGAFYNCAGLQSVTLNVESVGEYAFFNCNGLETVTFGQVLYLGKNAFYGCTGLKGVYPMDLSAWCTATFVNNYSNPISYAHAVYVDGEKAVDLTLPEVEKISACAFYGCRSLEEVTIPASVRIVEPYAFSGCEKLVHIRNYSHAAVDSPAIVGGEVAGGADEFSTELMTDSFGVRTYTVGEDRYLFGYVGSDYTLDLSGYVHLTGVYPYAFDSDDLVEITLPLNLTSVGEHAFDACDKLVHVRVLSSTEFEIETGATVGSEVIYGADASYRNTLRVWQDGAVTYEAEKQVYLIGYVGRSTELNFSAYGSAREETPEEPAEEPAAEEPAEEPTEEPSGEDPEEEEGPEEPEEEEEEPETGETIHVTSVYPYAFYGKTIRSVVLPEGLTTIGTRAFANCVTLTEAKLPASLTSVADDAFEGCVKLVRIVNKSTKVEVTSPAAVGGQVAADAGAMTSVETDVNGVSTYTVGGRTYLFGYEGASPRLALSRYASVTAIYPYALYGNMTLNELSITAGVKSIGEYAFLNAKKAVRITDLSAEPVYSYATFGEVIAQGEKFTHALRTDENGVQTFYAGDKVYLFGYVGTSGVVSLKNNTSITDVYPYAFAGNTTLTFVSLPDNVKTIPKGTFAGCGNLTGVTLPKSLTTVEEHAFDGCTALAQVTANSLAAWCGLTFLGTGSNPMYYAKSLATTETALTGTCVVTGVTEIPDYTFKNNADLTAVVVSDDVHRIGHYAFSGCANLRTVTIEGDGMEDIMNYAFASCTKLTTVKMGDGVKNVWSYAFYGCIELADVTMSGALRNLGTSVFSGCVALRRVDIPANLTTIGADAFKDCPLTSATIPTVAIPVVPKSRLQRAEITSGAIPFEAFRGCLTLTEVTVGNGVHTVGGSAFYGCSALSSLTVSASVTAIGTNAFYGCPITEAHIPTIVIPYLPKGALTTLEIIGGRSIGENAFNNCATLTNVTMAKSVTNLGKLAFGGCGNLLHIYYQGTRAEWNAVVKYVTSDGAESWDFGTTTYTVHCDDATFAKELLH